MEAIVLAGGLGTRLQPIVSDVPKPMAKIHEKPFLEHILRYLKHNGINRIILSVGYKCSIIENYFKNNYAGISIEYAVENEPLGTGGAILNACTSLRQNQAYIINGDTFFNVDLKQLLNSHLKNNSDLTLALKPMEKFDRYGNVEIDQTSKVVGFREKEYVLKGNINGGIYVFNKKIFSNFQLPQKFSFEEFMQQNIDQLNIYACVFDDYFIDIGIPEDYKKAQAELVHYL